MSDSLTYVVELWLGALGRACFQGTLVILAARLVEMLWQQMPANLRSWMWRLVFVKIALAAVFWGAIPLPILPPSQVSVATNVDRSHFTATEIRATQTIVPATQDAPASWNWSTIVGCIWLVGVGVHCGMLWQNRRQIQRQIDGSKSSAITHPYAMQLLASLVPRFALNRWPDLHLLAGNGSPCVIEGRRPIIFIPQNWLLGCNAEQLRLAIAHELAHLARRDLWWNQLITVCRIFLFFHPMVWLATRRYAAAQELACDELALQRTGGSSAVLARMLLQFVETEPAAVPWGHAAAMIGARSTLHERIVAMNRTLFSTPSSWSALLFVLIAVLVLPPFSVAEQPATGSPNDPPKTNPATPKVNRNEASASASGISIGISSDGNTTNISKSSAKAKVSNSGDEGKSVPNRSSSPSDSANPSSTRKAGNTNSKVQQTMTSKDDGTGEKWTRTTTAEETGRNIKIEESPNEIRVILKNTVTDKEVVTVAATPQELQKKSATAYELYRKYAAAPAKGSDAAAPAKGNDVTAAVKANLEKIAVDGDGNAAGLLKDQLRELRKQAEIQGTPLEGLLDELEKKIEGLK